MSLSDNLCAHEDRAICRREGCQHLLKRTDAGGDIAIETQYGEARKALGHLALEPFRTCSDAGDIDGATARATRWCRLGIGAVMTDESWWVLMENERYVARRTAKAAPAGATMQREGRTTPIEQDHCSPAITLDLTQRARQRARQRVVSVAREIDDLNRRQLATNTGWQLDVLERAPGLWARCGGGEHTGSSGCSRPHQRDRTGVVARVRLLLVRDLMLLIDDDQAQL